MFKDKTINNIRIVRIKRKTILMRVADGAHVTLKTLQDNNNCNNRNTR